MTRLLCRPSESLIRIPETKYYPTTIRVPHPQLRQFISATDEDWLYYAKELDIYALHLPSCRTSILFTTHFIPRCLTAGLGWVCAAGEHGECAFARLGADGRARSQVDTSLPVDLPGRETRRKSERKTLAEVVSEDIGTEIINSITVFELSNDLSDVTEPVALLSNNDKSVTIYSLLQRQIIAHLEHPMPMNYAVISPDSGILVAVGDSCNAFFYRRKRVGNTTWRICGTGESYLPKYEWEIFAVPKLSVGDTMRDDHSFSIAFSPSSHLCAVSSQGGIISIIDMSILGNLPDDESSDKAILYTIKSFGTGVWGCIRAMSFSPDPWDLFAWAEDHGKVGVADVRQYFCRRQMLQLDKHAPTLETVRLEDVTPPELKDLDPCDRIRHQRREREHRQSVGVAETVQGEHAPHIFAQTIARLRPAREPAYSSAMDLDARERSVMDSLEMTMDEVNEDALGPSHPYSLNYTSSPRVRPSLRSEGQATSEAQDRAYLPRRRSSIVMLHGAITHPQRTPHSMLAPRTLGRSRLTASPSRLPQTDNDEANAQDTPPVMSTNDLTPTSGGSSAQPLPYNIPQSDPWHVIQSALEAARASDGTADETEIVRLEAALDAERRLSLATSTSALPVTVVPLNQEARLRIESLEAAHHNILSLSELEAERQMRRTRLRQAAGIQPRPNADNTDNNTTTATTTMNTSGPALLNRTNRERHQRILDARAQARQRAVNATQTSITERPSTRRAELAATRASELDNRVSDAEMRLERMMVIANANSRQPADRNGNWMPGDPMAQIMASGYIGGYSDTESMLRAVERVERESGLGTAGLAWSPDGRSLFVGTEEGIFHYKVNLADRRCYPSIEYR